MRIRAIMLGAALLAGGLPAVAAAQALDLGALLALAQQRGGDDDDDGGDDAGPRGRRGEGRGEGRGGGREQREARDRVRQGQILPLGRVLGQVARRTPGRLLDAGLEGLGGPRPVYRVRWAAADGRRIDYFVDARSGAILGADGE